MPEQIRLKVGGVTPQQMAVYEEFSRSIPGFIPMGGSLSGELPTGTAADSTSNTTHTAASYAVKPLPVNVPYWIGVDGEFLLDYVKFLSLVCYLFHIAHIFAAVINNLVCCPC